MRQRARTLFSLITISTLLLSYQNCSGPVSIKPAEQQSTSNLPSDGNPQTSVCTALSTVSCQGNDPNGVYSKSCDSSGSSYGACQLSSCKSGYSLTNGQCQLTPTPSFNPSFWGELDSNSIFDFNNGGHLYYVNNKIVIMFMSMSAYFYVYDVATKTFITTPSVPSPEYPAIYDRAVSFALGNSIYLILGTTLWEYNTSTNAWTNKGTTPGNDHRRAFAFTVNGYAYVNGGFYNEGKTYKYSPSNNQWTSVSDHSFTNASYEHGSYFVINNKVYIYDYNLTEYDPSTDSYTLKKYRYFPSYKAFSINNKGYMVAAASQYTSPNILYSYDPINDSWIELKDYSPNYFCNLYGVGAGSSAYLFVGGNSNSCELWKLTP